ncbi:MAG: DUF3461 family protein [Oceanospirillaceae bacterium]|nr:DUF3461 family protein [Oceanospirillaceae bacterium]
MPSYPTLSAMGIRRTDDITRFTLHELNHSDELKIYFCRTDGDSQPRSMKFRFERPSASSATAAPELLQALEELRTLNRNSQATPSRYQLLNELNQLELVFKAKIEELRNNLQQWS